MLIEKNIFLFVPVLDVYSTGIVRTSQCDFYNILPRKKWFLLNMCLFTDDTTTT
jgi:hypothetical protein